jgi:hypothetical protein
MSFSTTPTVPEGPNNGTQANKPTVNLQLQKELRIEASIEYQKAVREQFAKDILEIIKKQEEDAAAALRTNPQEQMAARVQVEGTEAILEATKSIVKATEATVKATGKMTARVEVEATEAMVETTEAMVKATEKMAKATEKMVEATEARVEAKASATEALAEDAKVLPSTDLQLFETLIYSMALTRSNLISAALKPLQELEVPDIKHLTKDLKRDAVNAFQNQ